MVLETAVPKYLRRGRPITASASSGAAETVIWRSCRFVGALFRALKDLPGGLGRFIPGRIGGNHCRLRRIGWEQCGHGLTCRPRESRDRDVLDALLVLFGYYPGSADALLAGILKLRYCKRPVARLFPSWRLPRIGIVAGLSAPESLVPAAFGSESGGAGGSGSGGAGGSGSGGAGGSGSGGAGGPLVPLPGGAGGSGWCGLAGGPGGSWKRDADSGIKRIRLTRKTPLPRCFSPLAEQPMPKRWKRLRTEGDEASPMELALPPEEDGIKTPVTVFNRIGIS